MSKSIAPLIDDEVEEDEDEAEGEATPPKRRGLWLRWLGICLLPLVGASLGYLTQGLLHTVETDHQPPSSDHAPSNPAAAPVAQIASDPEINMPEIGEIDSLLSAGDYQRARALFQDGQTSNQVLLPADLRARYALCAELYGDSKLALGIYRELAGGSTDHYLQRFAQISQARLHYALGEFGQSESILYELALTTADGTSQREQEATWHLLAQVNTDRLHTDKNSQDLLTTTSLAGGSRDWFRPLLFPELANGTKPELATELPSDIVLEGWKSEASFSDIQGKVTTRQVEVQRLLDELASRLQLSFQYSSLSKEILRGRTRRVNVESIELPNLLDALLSPLELSWQREESGEIRITAQKEFTSANQVARAEERAQRIALHAITQFPASAGEPVTRFKLANLAFLRGEFESAAAEYRQLIQKRPATAIRQASWFNLAKTQYHTENWDGAREAFLRVVDESRGHALEPAAYLWLARIEQEALNYEKAQSHLVRAIALAKDENTKCIATVTMAANLLLTGDASTAALTLQEHRDELLNSKQQRSAAALLSAIARQENPTQEQNIALASRLLTTAIIQAKVDDFLGYLGFSLLARGYRLLGLTEQEIATLEAAVMVVPKTPLHLQMRMDLVTKQVSRQLDDRARPHLAYLLEHGSDVYHFRALLISAQISFRAGNSELCTEQLRKLLDEEVPSDVRDQALALLGRTYSRAGRHYEAAMCFAGLLPGEGAHGHSTPVSHEETQP